MNFTVIWKHSAVDRLTGFYVDALEHGQDANAITVTASRIDTLLANDPANQGESRQGEERVLIVPPLSVDFEVFEEQRVVLVLAVRYFSPK